jgi:hypothetical protein
MIPLIVFVALVLMLIPLFLYAFIDHRNKLYANIVSAFLCAIIAAYLGVVISIGIVQYDPSAVYNGLTWTNTSIYDVHLETISFYNLSSVGSGWTMHNGAVIQDASLGYIFMLFSVIMMIYSLYMVYEAYDEMRMRKKQEDD